MNDSPDTPNALRSDATPERSSPWTVFLWLGLIPLAIAILISLQYWLGLHPPGANPESDQPGVGRKLPQLRLEPLTGGGRPVGLADVAGHVVLIDFWGTWCPPCRAEFPHLAALGAKFRDHADFMLLAVSCGNGPKSENIETLRRDTEDFLADEKLYLPTYADPGGYSRLGVDMVATFEGYPTTLVLDRQGVIRGFWVGYEPGTERQIERLIGELLVKPREPEKSEKPQQPEMNGNERK